MQFDWWTFGLQTVNFIILVWLLKIFLYAPVLRAIKRRQDENTALMDKARLAEKMAGEESEKFRAKRHEIEAAREQILEDARIDESRAHDKLMQEGHEEIARLKDIALKDIEREQNKARISVRQEATDLAVSLARNILEQSYASSLQDMFLEKIVAYLEALAPAEFKNLQDQLQDVGLTVISAEELNKENQDKWCRAINGVFRKEIQYEFRTDAGLIAGVNLKFANALLAFNWQASLQQAKDSLYEQADR